MITKDNAYLALCLALAIAPDGRAQRAITALYNREDRTGATATELFDTMLGIINDGRNYGKWPKVPAEERP